MKERDCCMNNCKFKKSKGVEGETCKCELYPSCLGKGNGTPAPTMPTTPTAWPPPTPSPATTPTASTASPPVTPAPDVDVWFLIIIFAAGLLTAVLITGKVATDKVAADRDVAMAQLARVQERLDESRRQNDMLLELLTRRLGGAAVARVE